MELSEGVTGDPPRKMNNTSTNDVCLVTLLHARCHTDYFSVHVQHIQGGPKSNSINLIASFLRLTIRLDFSSK